MRHTHTPRQPLTKSSLAAQAEQLAHFLTPWGCTKPSSLAEGMVVMPLSKCEGTNEPWERSKQNCFTLVSQHTHTCTHTHMHCSWCPAVSAELIPGQASGICCALQVSGEWHTRSAAACIWHLGDYLFANQAAAVRWAGGYQRMIKYTEREAVVQL